jgi:hypothetical protein
METLHKIRELSSAERQLAFAKLSTMLVNPQAQHFVDLIAEDSAYNPSANYDPTNQMYADDLLMLAYQLTTRFGDDLIRTLETQLADMAGGPCSQGRATRLFQVVAAFLELE